MNVLKLHHTHYRLVEHGGKEALLEKSTPKMQFLENDYPNSLGYRCLYTACGTVLEALFYRLSGEMEHFSLPAPPSGPRNARL
jgi:hypothetical protein